MRVLCDSWHQRLRPRVDPYRWLRTDPGDLFPTPVGQRLLDSFPDDGYARRDASHRDNGKTYRNYSRVLIAADGGPPTDPAPVPPLWRDLLADLTSPAYRAAVAGVLNQPPARALEVRLVRHAPGDWLAPHTDQDDKLFSHILYFNPGWQPDWGGCLEVLRGADPSQVAARVTPTLGASVLFGQAANSWHQVTPVAGHLTTSRRSLLVHGLR